MRAAMYYNNSDIRLEEVSVTTIGRVARFLTDGFGGYTAALEQSKAAHTPRKSRASH